MMCTLSHSSITSSLHHRIVQGLGFFSAVFYVDLKFKSGPCSCSLWSKPQLGQWKPLPGLWIGHFQHYLHPMSFTQDSSRCFSIYQGSSWEPGKKMTHSLGPKLMQIIWTFIQRYFWIPLWTVYGIKLSGINSLCSKASSLTHRASVLLQKFPDSGGPLQTVFFKGESERQICLLFPCPGQVY